MNWNWQLGKSATLDTAPSRPDRKKLRALIDQAIEALGGNAYLNITDMTQEGRSYNFHHGEPSGAGGLFWRFYRFPDKERIELQRLIHLLSLVCPHFWGMVAIETEEMFDGVL